MGGIFSNDRRLHDTEALLVGLTPLESLFKHISESGTEAFDGNYGLLTEPDIWGRTAIMVASRYAKLEWVTFLRDTIRQRSEASWLEAVSATDEEGHCAAHYVAYSGDEQCMEALLQGLDPATLGVVFSRCHATGRKPILSACLRGNIGSFRQLLSKGADIFVQDYCGNNVLHCLLKAEFSLPEKKLKAYDAFRREATRHLPEASIIAMLSHKNNRRQTPKQLADFQMVDVSMNFIKQWLEDLGNPNIEIDHYLRVNPIGNDVTSRYFRAVEIGDIITMEDLLRYQELNIETQNTRQQTALIVAAMNGQAHVVRRLLRKNANVCAADRWNMTALTWAAYFGENEVVSDLLRTPYAKTLLSINSLFLNRSPLFYASIRGPKTIPEMMLEHGAEIVPDEDNLTPISMAASRDCIQILRTLCYSNQTDFQLIDKADKFGKTAESWSQLQAHNDTTNFIRYHKSNKSIVLTMASLICSTLLLFCTFHVMWFDEEKHQCMYVPMIIQAAGMFFAALNLFIHFRFSFELAVSIVEESKRDCCCTFSKTLEWRSIFSSGCINRREAFKIWICDEQVLTKIKWSPFLYILPLALFTTKIITDGCFDVDSFTFTVISRFVIILSCLLLSVLAIVVMPLMLLRKDLGRNCCICIFLRKSLYPPLTSQFRISPQTTPGSLLPKAKKAWEQALDKAWQYLCRILVLGAFALGEQIINSPTIKPLTSS